VRTDLIEGQDEEPEDGTRSIEDKTSEERDDQEAGKRHRNQEESDKDERRKSLTTTIERIIQAKSGELDSTPSPHFQRRAVQ
jgi:hypothetical protein